MDDSAQDFPLPVALWKNWRVWPHDPENRSWSSPEKQDATIAIQVIGYPNQSPIIRWWRWWIISIDENLWSPKISINWRCVYHLRLSRPAIPCYPAQRSPQRARTRCGANRASPPAGASWTSTGWTPKRWLRCRGDHGGDGDDWTGRKKLMKWLYNLPIYGKWWEKWWNMVKKWMKHGWQMMNNSWWVFRDVEICRIFASLIILHKSTGESIERMVAGFWFISSYQEWPLQRRLKIRNEKKTKEIWKKDIRSTQTKAILEPRVIRKF